MIAYRLQNALLPQGKTLRQQGKQERSARPRKRDGLPRAPLLGELPSVSDG